METKGKLGQNFTPAKAALRLVKRALPKVKELYDKGEYQKLIDYIISIRIFDPTCGEGAILIAAYVYLNTYLKAACEKLNREVLRVKPSQFYGIEIDRYYANRCKTWFNEKDSSEDPNILCANSLAIDWVAFTHGTENVSLIGNFPFESKSELDNSDLGKETNVLWHAILGSTDGTCDAAFFAKAHKSGYKIYAIGHNTSVWNIDGLMFSEKYSWASVGGNANICVREYSNYIDLHDDSMVVLPNPGKMLTDWITLDGRISDHAKSHPVGRVVARAFKGLREVDGSKAVAITRGVDYIMSVVAVTADNPVKSMFIVTDADYATETIVVVAPTEWTLKALSSRAFIVWASRTAKSYQSETRYKWSSIMFRTFPLFQGDDLDHYESMTDEEIFQELLAKYNALINKD